MNITENGSNLIGFARELVLQSDSASYQRGVIEMVANYLQVDYTEAVDLIHDTETPKNEHIILVAFHMVGPETMKDAQLELMELLPDEGDVDNRLESWWVAMDERYQASDNDSAEFVPGTGRDAWYRYHEQAGTRGITRPEPANVFDRWNNYPRRSGYIVTDYSSMGSLRDLRGSIYGKIQGFEFANFAEGKVFIDKMNQLIAVYGIATLNDALDLLGIEHKRFAGEKMGWSTRLDPTASLRAIKYKHEYTLDLPTPTHAIR